MSGTAGSVLGLLMAVCRGGDHSTLEIAMNFGQEILARGNRHEFGLSWTTTKNAASRDLTGLSHGAAGIALTLLELGMATKERTFIAAAELGFEYEDHWFEPQVGNWPDFRMNVIGRASSPEPAYDVAWCHGAPGIGLSRLRAYELTRKEKYRKSAEAAIAITLKCARDL